MKMLLFYKYASSLFLTVLIASILFIFGGISLSKINTRLLPNSSSAISWTPDTEPKSATSQTTLTINEEGKSIDYDFYLAADEPYPYTSYAFNFANKNDTQELADLTPFDLVSFKILCEPRNILLFVLFTFDNKTTTLSDSSSYRVNSTFFTCDKSWRTVVVQLNNLDTPDWWLQNSGLELIDREYQLDKVISFALVNSLQSPRETPSNIKISDVMLVGENWFYIYTSVALTGLIWMLFLFWIVRRYISELVQQVKDKMQQDRPLIAYQKLSITPQKDKEKSAVLRHLATEYSNPELSIESTATQLGINRNKINEILKEELELTFSVYINKLRLTESARLLTEHSEMNIAQIAYAVGFNNVTYFNKLFKNEYGCTPKTFKNNYRSEQNG